MWDASGIPIAPKAKQYAGENAIRPGETATGRGRVINGTKQITKRDVRDAIGKRNRAKRKEEKREAQAGALQQNREASEGAEPSGTSGEAAPREAAPWPGDEAGEGRQEPPFET
jgi:hypothetical protein